MAPSDWHPGHIDRPPDPHSHLRELVAQQARAAHNLFTAQQWHQQILIYSSAHCFNKAIAPTLAALLSVP
jgi:hypothetical protein